LVQRLGVNVDHVATLRQARRASYPDPVTAAALAELAGAEQITIHLREDRRHIQDRDLRILRETVQTVLNLEMAATQEMVKIAYEHKPDTVTLVPERREEVTTEGGLDVVNQRDAIARVVKNLRDGDIVVSLFIDPDLDQVRASHKVNAQRVEIHTGRYCEAHDPRERERELARIVDASKAAAKLGMGVAAGHGLNYENVKPVARVREIDELNIGHAIVARAVLVGFERAVREMLELMRVAASEAGGR
jgi:pyridoxine 5-phosphate synthase